MTDFKQPPAFHDPINRCPKCLRSDMFTPRYSGDQYEMPATILWIHVCGYTIVTRTADSVPVAG